MFGGSCLQECGALVGDSFESCIRKSKMAAILPAKSSGQSKMAAIVLAKISGYITARAIQDGSRKQSDLVPIEILSILIQMNTSIDLQYGFRNVNTLIFR